MELENFIIAGAGLTLFAIVLAILAFAQERRFQKQIEQEKRDGTYLWPSGRGPGAHPAE